MPQTLATMWALPESVMADGPPPTVPGASTSFVETLMKPRERQEYSVLEGVHDPPLPTPLLETALNGPRIDIDASWTALLTPPSARNGGESKNNIAKHARQTEQSQPHQQHASRVSVRDKLGQSTRSRSGSNTSKSRNTSGNQSENGSAHGRLIQNRSQQKGPDKSGESKSAPATKASEKSWLDTSGDSKSSLSTKASDSSADTSAGTWQSRPMGLVNNSSPSSVGTGSSGTSNASSTQSRQGRGGLFRKFNSLWGDSKGSVNVSAGSGYGLPENTCIMIDWDDTLLPTSFINDVVAPSLAVSGNWSNEGAGWGSLPPSSPYYANLEDHAQLVTNVLIAARQLGRVAIVTLASREWVMSTAEWYLPGLDLPGLMEQLDISIYYANRYSSLAKHQASVGGNPALVAKKTAMWKCLKAHYADNNSCWNVISIGDATYERDAAKECTAELGPKSRTLCKTLKLRDNPTLSQLSTDLELLVSSLPALVADLKSYDRTSDKQLVRKASTLSMLSGW